MCFVLVRIIFFPYSRKIQEKGPRQISSSSISRSNSLYKYFVYMVKFWLLWGEMLWRKHNFQAHRACWWDFERGGWVDPGQRSCQSADWTRQDREELRHSTAGCPFTRSWSHNRFVLGNVAKAVFWCMKSRRTRLGSNDGELEASRAGSTATERPNREAPVRRRFHELCANLNTMSSSAYHNIPAALAWRYLSAFFPVCQLEERFEIREQILQDIHSKRLSLSHFTSHFGPVCAHLEPWVLNVCSGLCSQLWTRWSWRWEKHQTPSAPAARDWTPGGKGGF